MTYSQMIYMYCILIGCRCTPLQGDMCSHRYDLRPVCLHLPSDDIGAEPIQDKDWRLCVSTGGKINLFKVSDSCEDITKRRCPYKICKFLIKPLKTKTKTSSPYNTTKTVSY